MYVYVCVCIKLGSLQDSHRMTRFKTRIGLLASRLASDDSLQDSHRMTRFKTVPPHLPFFCGPSGMNSSLAI